MRLPSTKSLALLAGAVAISASTFIGTASAASVTTDPVGYVSNFATDGSESVAKEVLISAALHRSAVFVSTVDSIPTGNTIVVSGTPGWDADEFAANTISHYAVFSSGDKEGLWAIISGNSSNSLELAFVNEDLGSVDGDRVEVGDSVKIIPFWTLSTLLPSASVPNESQVLVFDRSEAGINKSAIATYTLFSDFGWYNGPEEGNNTVIYPDESVVLRIPAGEMFTYIHSGTVPMFSFRSSIETIQPGAAQDVRFTSGVPIAVTLGELLDPGADGDGDQVLIFDNAEGGINKSAIITATYFEGFGWYNGPNEVNSFQLDPGQGIIYRKSAHNGADVVVNFKPSYLINEL